MWFSWLTASKLENFLSIARCLMSLRAAESGRRSKVFATLLSAFPGAGQMYLGLQNADCAHGPISWRIYVLDVLKLSLFLF